MRDRFKTDFIIYVAELSKKTTDKSYQLHYVHTHIWLGKICNTRLK